MDLSDHLDLLDLSEYLNLSDPLDLFRIFWILSDLSDPLDLLDLSDLYLFGSYLYGTAS